MPRLTWGASGSRLYEAGVDRGVLYVGTQPGVPWDGLTSVSESSSGGEPTPYYIDGVKYLNVPAAEEFEATITAFTYPDAFAECDGTQQPRAGLFLSQQRRKPFSFSYRTKIGNDQTADFAYKIHIVYEALASPTSRNNTTLGDSIDPVDFSWAIKTKPPALSGYTPTSHVVIDSRTTEPSVLALVEDILYGNDVAQSRLPSFTELIEAFDTASELVITDNGDGTWTATAPFDTIRMLDDTVFEITSPTAVFIDADSYNISSSS